MFSVREQSLPTRSNLKKWGWTPTHYCRHCTTAERIANGTAAVETTDHITSGCVDRFGMSLYKERQDQICTYIRQRILKSVGKEASPRWWTHKPAATTDLGEDGVLFWDRSWRGDYHLPHNKPDIVWQRREEVLVIEVGCPLDKNVVATEEVKSSKYGRLNNELYKQFGKTTVTVPIVVGNTGVITEKFQAYVEQLEIGAQAHVIQKIATRVAVMIAKNLTCTKKKTKKNQKNL